MPLKESAFEKRTAGGSSAQAAARSFTITDRGMGMIVAILRRFWAAAARRNSSRAPLGPCNRGQTSQRMRLKCANSISTSLRSRCETLTLRGDPFVFLSDRTGQTMSAVMDRSQHLARIGTGQQRGLSAQASQSSLLARQR